MVTLPVSVHALDADVACEFECAEKIRPNNQRDLSLKQVDDHIQFWPDRIVVGNDGGEETVLTIRSFNYWYNTHYTVYRRNQDEFWPR